MVENGIITDVAGRVAGNLNIYALKACATNLRDLE